MQIYRAPVVLPVSAPPIRDGAVAVNAGRIVSVTRVEHAPPGDVREFDGVLLPGLVNAHTHLCFSAYADMYGNGKEFSEWIGEFARRNPTMSDSAWRESARLGVDASLRAGTTGVADVVTPPQALPVLLDSGLAGTLFFEACFIDKRRWAEYREEFVKIVDEAFGRRDVRDADPRVGVSPHTLYTLGRTVGVDLAEIARERGMRLHPHLAETAHEDAYVREGAGVFADMVSALDAEFELLDGGSGVSPTSEMDRWGLLGSDSHVAHGVHLDAADRALLRDRGVSVAMCARSNARLESGEPPVAAHRAEGNPVAVGTDSLTSSPDLDVSAELPILRSIALRQGDDGDGLDEWLVRAATQGGALAMGRRDFGVLEVDARADLAVFDVDAGDDPYAAFVSDAAGACTATVLAGELIEHR
ncbi:MAG: amidohydrolase family protein [Stackebrandtia sp.]